MSRARNFPHPIRQLLAWGLALLASVLVAGAAHAQEAAPRKAVYGDENIAVELLIDPAAPKGTAMLALRFTPKAREWHGYWSNPGDAGQGMRLTLDLPAGWEAGAPLYPVPKRLVISGLMNHIYEGPYTVLVPVTPGPGATVQATVTGTGALAATVLIDVGNISGSWLNLGTLSLSGNDAVTDGLALDAHWVYIRANCTTLTGTGATLNVVMGTRDRN